MPSEIDTPAFSRRKLLIGAGAVGVVGAATAVGATRPWDALTASSAATAPAGKRTLVVCTMYGGNDGLNMVVPFTDPAYHAGRPDLGYQPHEVLAITKDLGLNPKMPGMKALWDAKQLAVVLGVGYDNPSLSHFQSMDIWQTANPDGSGTGWLGRWLDGSKHDPMRAISVGSVMPTLLLGDHTTATALTASTITLPGGVSYQSEYTQLMGNGPDRTGLSAAVAQSGSDLVAVKGQLDSYHAAAGAPTPTATSSGASGAKGKGKQAGTLSDQLAIVSALIRAGAPTQVYQVSLSPFDTHSNEREEQERMLAELDAGVSSFFQSLTTSREGDGVVLMTFSEFGRRVAQNASGGTDHGTASPLFIAGRGVRGGQLYGEQPSLTKLDPNGNLVHNVDFRSVYATMLADVVGVDPASALGASYPTLKVL